MRQEPPESSQAAASSDRDPAGTILGLGDDLYLDVVSRPDPFARLWPKLRAGYLLDGLGRLDEKPPTASQITAFVEDVDHSLDSRQPPPGSATTFA